LSDQLQRHQELSLGKKHAKYLVRDVETIQLLTGLSEYLPRVLKPLNTDLVTLTRACGALLKRIYDAHEIIDGKAGMEDSTWKIPSTLSFQPVLNVLSDKACLEGRQLLKGKADVPRSPYVEAASNVISEYLAAGAIGVVDEPLEKHQKCIAYHFGVAGPAGRNRTDGTPYSWDKKEIQRKLATREMQERIKDLVQRGVVDEVIRVFGSQRPERSTDWSMGVGVTTPT
jgi:hypothetical protein